MLTFVAVAFLIVVLIVAIVIYKKTQHDKAVQENTQSLTNRVRQIQDGFKERVLVLVDAGLIDTQQRQKITAIANNFFVFQSINEENIFRLIELAESFIQGANSHPSLIEQSDERLSELLATLAAHLPQDPRDFSENYYANTLPGLLFEFANQVTSLESAEQLESEADGSVPDAEQTA